MTTPTVVLILALAVATYAILSAIANHFYKLTDHFTMLFSDLATKVTDAKAAVAAIPDRVVALTANTNA